MQKSTVKKVCVMCILITLLAVTGCNGNNVPPATTTETAQHEQANPFEAFASGLTALGMSFESNWIAGQMVGAENGYRYTLTDGRIELYEFDASSEAFALVVANQAITLGGFGDFPVVVAGNMALSIDSDISDYGDIVELFFSLFE